MPPVQHLARMVRQRLQLKVEEFDNIQRPRLVLLVERDVLRLEQFAVEHALLNQELRPLEIAVAAQQGIVQIE